MEQWFISYEVLTNDGRQGKGFGIFDRLESEDIKEFSRRMARELAETKLVTSDRIIFVGFNKV